MKKIIPFFILLICIVISCDDDNNIVSTYTSYYLTNKTTYDLDLKENYWRGCRANDTIELHAIRNKSNKSYLEFESTLLVWYLPDDHRDSSLQISHYKIPLSEIKYNQDNAFRYENYYFYITDSIFQDVKDSMAIQGYYPQLHELW